MCCRVTSVVALVHSPRRDGPPAAGRAGPRLRIVALGDSDTAGNGDPAHLGWVGRYARLLRQKLGLQVAVVNLARDGKTIANLLSEVRSTPRPAARSPAPTSCSSALVEPTSTPATTAGSQGLAQPSVLCGRPQGVRARLRQDSHSDSAAAPAERRRAPRDHAPERAHRRAGRDPAVPAPSRDEDWRLPGQVAPAGDLREGPRMQMFVGGAWATPRRARPSARVARDRRDDRRGPAGRPRGRAARDRGREPAPPRLGPRDRVRAGRRDAPRRRRDRAAPRRARPHADARPGQAAARRGLRRGRRARRATGATRAEDGKRLEGRLPNSVSPGKRVLLVRRPRGVVRRDHALELAVHDAGRADRAGARVRATPSSGRPPSTTAVAAVALAECVAEADLPPGVFNLVTGPGLGGRRRDRPQPGHARRRLHRLDRDRPAGRRGGGRQGARCSSWAATARSSCSTTPTSTPPPRRRVTACFLCAGQSCTAGERLLVHRDVRDEFVERLARARRRAGPARRPVRRRRRRSGR